MPAFHYTRAARVLAEAELLGDNSARLKWGVKRSTFFEWKSRLDADEKLKSLFEREKASLLSSWEADAISLMRVCFQKLKKVIEAVEEDGDPRKIQAVSVALKTLGDLAIASRVLDEPDDEDSDS